VFILTATGRRSWPKEPSFLAVSSASSAPISPNGAAAAFLTRHLMGTPDRNSELELGDSGTGGLVDWRTGTGSLDYAKERAAHQAIECSESCSCNAATRRMRNARVKALNQSARELETLLSATRMASQLAVIRVWFGLVSV